MKMAAVNRITKYNLENRTRELNESGTSLRDIADILTNESRHKISKDSVFTFLKSDERYTAEIVESKTQLKAKVAEIEISTIEQRKQVIDGLLGLAQSAENEHTRVLAFKEANNALDSLDKRLGKLTGDRGVTINNINAVKLEEISTEQLLRMINATT
jgi:DNA-binding transcriptional MerR regulator